MFQVGGKCNAAQLFSSSRSCNLLTCSLTQHQLALQNCCLLRVLQSCVAVYVYFRLLMNCPSGYALRHNPTQQQRTPKGCKYVRGEWSATCTDGLRVRVDRLVSRVGSSRPEASVATTGSRGGKQSSSSAAGDQQLLLFQCQPERRVTKDCKRACHYIKSGEFYNDPHNQTKQNY